MRDFERCYDEAASAARQALFLNRNLILLEFAVRRLAGIIGRACDDGTRESYDRKQDASPGNVSHA